MMEISLFGKRAEIESPGLIHTYSEESRKRPYSYGVSQLSSNETTSTTEFSSEFSSLSSPYNLISQDNGSHTFVSSLKRSKRTIDLTTLNELNDTCGQDPRDFLRPVVALDLAAMVANPPAGCESTDMEWVDTGLYLTSDGGCTSGSEYSCKGQFDDSKQRRDHRSFPRSTDLLHLDSSAPSLQPSRNCGDLYYPPQKLRRNSERAEDGALDSWLDLQRVLDTDEHLQRNTPTGNHHSFSGLSSSSSRTASSSVLLSKPSSVFPNDIRRSANGFSAVNGSAFVLGTSTVGNGNTNTNNNSNGSGGYGYKHSRKLASLASMAKKPSTRMLSSAASAAATAAVQSSIFNETCGGLKASLPVTNSSSSAVNCDVSPFHELNSDDYF